MELSSLAENAEIPLPEVLGAHCYAALMASRGEESACFESGMIALPAAAHDGKGPLLGLVWRIAPYSFPHLCVVVTETKPWAGNALPDYGRRPYNRRSQRSWLCHRLK